MLPSAYQIFLIKIYFITNLKKFWFRIIFLLFGFIFLDAKIFPESLYAYKTGWVSFPIPYSIKIGQ